MKESENNKAITPEDLPLDVKLDTIERSESLEDLKRINTGYLPPVPLVKPDNYYFISYSHKDYKRVYKDIFALQARGVNIWYDRGMRAGADWKEVADEYITPAKCAGVIFYISENSLASGAIHTEIEYAKKCGKSCLTVNLPIGEDWTFGGESVKGQEVSARKLLDIMGANGAGVAKDKYEFISNAFGDDVIFVKYSDGADEKCEKILSMKRPPLLEVSWNIGDDYTINVINDHDIKKLDKADYSLANISEKEELYSVDKIKTIESCAFANCGRLERVYLPERLTEINTDVFYGCKSLKEIDLSRIMFIHGGAFQRCSSLEKVDISNALNIDNYAFSGCTNLKEVVFRNNVSVIGDYAFENCKNLKSVELGRFPVEIGDGAFRSSGLSGRLNLDRFVVNVGNYAFNKCNGIKEVVFSAENASEYISEGMFSNCSSLERIVFSEAVKEIRSFAFMGCKSLKKLTIPDRVKTICTRAFSLCTSLEEVNLPVSLCSVQLDAFSKCPVLKRINYNGSKEDWQKIKFSGSGHIKTNTKSVYTTILKKIGLGNNDLVVYCTDGIIENEGAVFSKEVLQKLETAGKRGMKFGTERTRTILNALGSPDDKLKIIHVAGTNGKGSVTRYIHNILRANGVTVGSFTSPEVYDYAECFYVNEEKISYIDLAESFNAVFALEESKNATRFEIETAAAINAFAAAGCEYAVLECGMGGLNDATNAVNKKELAVITSISLEHTQFLGNTVREICEQKAGIIKNCPAIVGAYNSEEVKEYFKSLGTVIADCPEHLENIGQWGIFDYAGEKYFPSNFSTAQAYNAVLAIQTAKILGFEANGLAFRRTALPGRLQHVNTAETDYLLDGAHNPAAFVPLVEHVKAYCDREQVTPQIIYGCLSDKDTDGCVGQLKGLSSSIYAVQPPSPRAMPIEKISEVCAKYFDTVHTAKSVSEALDTARGKFVVVCGSFTLLKEAREWIEKRQ